VVQKLALSWLFRFVLRSISYIRRFFWSSVARLPLNLANKTFSLSLKWRTCSNSYSLLSQDFVRTLSKLEARCVVSETLIYSLDTFFIYVTLNIIISRFSINRTEIYQWNIRTIVMYVFLRKDFVIECDYIRS
jgi:hypothetical protein